MPVRFDFAFFPPTLPLYCCASVVAVLVAQVSEGGIDAKALAMLGVLSAINAALRPLGAGTAGIEPVFFLLILSGRVFGPGFAKAKPTRCGAAWCQLKT